MEGILFTANQYIQQTPRRGRDPMKLGTGMTPDRTHPGVVLAREMVDKSKTYQESQAIIKQFFYLTKREQEFFLLYVGGYFARKNGGDEAVADALAHVSDVLEEVLGKKSDK